MWTKVMEILEKMRDSGLKPGLIAHSVLLGSSSYERVGGALGECTLAGLLKKMKRYGLQHDMISSSGVLSACVTCLWIDTVW